MTTRASSSSLIPGKLYKTTEAVRFWLPVQKAAVMKDPFWRCCHPQEGPPGRVFMYIRPRPDLIKGWATLYKRHEVLLLNNVCIIQLYREENIIEVG